MRTACLALSAVCLTAFEAVAGGFVAGAEIGVSSGVAATHGSDADAGVRGAWIACQPPAACADAIGLRTELERFRRAQQLRAGVQPNADAAAAAASIGPYGIRRYVPPPTPEANIQPAYRGASRLRPEYDEPVRAAPDTR